jgi:hypothetical protein
MSSKSAIIMRPLSSLLPVIRPGKPGLNFFPLVLACLLAAACGGRIYLVSSLGPPHAIVVDGDANDWSGALSYVAKDHLFVGFVNDRDDLFICMTKEISEGRGPAGTGGWTVWFDPAGGTEKTLGLRLALAQPEEGPERRADGKPVRKPVEESSDLENGQQPPIDRSGDLEILGPKGDVRQRLSPEAAARLGLEVKTGFAGGSFVMEIRIPLVASERQPLAVGAGPEGVIGVGFLSSRSDQKDRRNGPPGRGMGGGGGRPGGGIGAGAMGGPSGGMRGALPPNLNPDLAKSVKIWTRVKLRQSDQPGRSTTLSLISQ